MSKEITMNSEFRTFRSLNSFKKVAKANGLRVKLVSQSKSKEIRYFQAISPTAGVVGFFTEGPAGWLSVKTTGHINRAHIAK